MNIFEEIKVVVDITTAAEYYGLNVRKNTTFKPFTGIDLKKYIF